MGPVILEKLDEFNYGKMASRHILKRRKNENIITRSSG
ncbi:hypothetical protein SeGA_4002 [Salmonella enterica subsp. enterica serovar Gaminara str. A4-567]|nr:hypothetical protein SeGA_4002 [Salmonella enterica subsp. enterica serovar Gaminara str. A4-567]EHC62873.1 hypothetical protein LTSEMIN_4545 [Salmonella enterica subsp. enterica serovar Minnesota str. A4-603]